MGNRHNGNTNYITIINSIKMNVVVKVGFMDNNLKRVEPGQPMTMSKERGQRLVELGFVTSGDEPKVEPEAVEPPVKVNVEHKKAPVKTLKKK